MPTQSLININQLSHWSRFDGTLAMPPSGDAGAFFPRLTSNIVYREGIVWGGFVNDPNPNIEMLRVGGSTFRVGLDAGWIEVPGTPTSPPIAAFSSDPAVRVYRIRPDWQSLTIDSRDIIIDAAEQNDIDTSDVTATMAQAVLDQYQLDWTEWPGQFGAPFIDVNNNGTWETGTDMPGIANADQVLWFACNDLDPGRTNELYGSPPIGLELQTTIWAYKSAGSFGDVHFRRFRIINKSGYSIDSMFVCNWIDTDIGYFLDDLVGYAPTAELGYAYNSTAFDQQFDPFGLAPPAAGYSLLQGPIVSAPGETGYFDFQPVNNSKNLPLTSFSYVSAASNFGEPTLGAYEGTQQFYNMLNGYLPTPDLQNPQPYIHGAGPKIGQATKFPLDGNPLTGNGDIDGEGNNLAAGDRRIILSSGPFYLADKDSQEIVLALIADNRSDGLRANRANTQSIIRKAKNLQNIIVSGIAVDVEGKQYVSLNETTVLLADFLFLTPGDAINTAQWRIEQSPAGSNPQLSAQLPDSATFTAASPGSYTIALDISTVLGKNGSGTIEIEVTNNQVPVPAFTFSTTEFTWGDSVLVDAQSSFDPDGDSLTFEWIGYADISPIDNGEKAWIKPRSAGNVPISLVASDSLAGKLLTQSVSVLPKSNNIAVVETFTDSLWNRDVPFIRQDTLLVSRPADSAIGAYQISSGGIQFLTDAAPVASSAIITIQNSRIYTTTSNSIAVPTIGNLSVYQLSNNWQITPFLENYNPDLRDLAQFAVAGKKVLVSNYQNLFLLDIETSPGNPVILKERFLQNSITRELQASGEHFYALIDSFGTFRLEIMDTTSLMTISVDSLDIIARTMVLKDSYLFFGNPDSLHIFYKAAPSAMLDRLSAVRVENPAPTYGLSNTSHYGYLIRDDLIAVEKWNGIELIDFSDPLNPQAVGNWFGGTPQAGAGYRVAAHLDDIFMLPRRLSYLDWNPYAGFNRISTPLSVKSNKPSTHIKSIELLQNYPNPFNPTTIIKFRIPTNNHVKLVIYDLLGRPVKTLIDGKIVAGSHQITWDGKTTEGHRAASGIYFYKLVSGDFKQSRKMILAR